MDSLDQKTNVRYMAANTAGRYYVHLDINTVGTHSLSVNYDNHTIRTVQVTV